MVLLLVIYALYYISLLFRNIKLNSQNNRHFSLRLLVNKTLATGQLLSSSLPQHILENALSNWKNYGAIIVHFLTMTAR